MAAALLPDPLWDLVEPFLPILPRRPQGGRRLRVRYDKRADIHESFLSLGCALICWRSLRKIWMTG